uniref:RCC1 domain-containing protein 1-like isoform X2 n=1 Tax=Crassostrea virginica TaxID=6565 RepID=A0A8B8A9L4_CRAVI|nr:RCC1 domain-containing protein 1-like isoform X2 [Crassostrea virginica]
MWVTLFGFNGFAVLKRLKKQLNNDRDKINNLLLSSNHGCMKSADKPCKLSVSNLKMLAPEEILELKCDAVQACKATLQDIVIVTTKGDEYSLFSSLNSEKGIVKDLHICTGRDKLVTVFDKNVYQSDKDTLSGKLIYSADNQILHAGGTDDTLILAEERRLLTMKVTRDISPPLEIPMEFRVTGISCGKEHTLILTDCGTVYSFGGGSRGQLGLSHVENRACPCPVGDLTGVRMTCVAAGGWHSMALSDLGDLYVWRWNESGQLGLPCRNISTLTPPPTEKDNYLSSSPETAEKSAAWFTRVYMGHTLSKQCQAHIQRVGPVQVQPEPTVLDLGEDVRLVKVACGSRHSAVVTEDGHLLTTGRNDYGQLCHNDTHTRDYFQSVDYFLWHQMMVKDVFSGLWSTIVFYDKLCSHSADPRSQAS